MEFHGNGCSLHRNVQFADAMDMGVKLSRAVCKGWAGGDKSEKGNRCFHGKNTPSNQCS